jgi:hypothetical protein
MKVREGQELERRNAHQVIRVNIARDNGTIDGLDWVGSHTHNLDWYITRPIASYLRSVLCINKKRKKGKKERVYAKSVPPLHLLSQSRLYRPRNLLLILIVLHMRIVLLVQLRRVSPLPLIP